MEFQNGIEIKCQVSQPKTQKLGLCTRERALSPPRASTSAPFSFTPPPPLTYPSPATCAPCAPRIPLPALPYHATPSTRVCAT